MRRPLILKSVVPALVAAFALIFPSGGALAQKSQFERTKPHVNVGTIGVGKTSSSQETECGAEETAEPAEDDEGECPPALVAPGASEGQSSGTGLAQ